MHSLTLCVCVCNNDGNKNNSQATAVQAPNGLKLFIGLYTCTFSKYSKRTVVLCAECIVAGSFWKDNELNMVPFQGFCLRYTLPPKHANFRRFRAFITMVTFQLLII